MDGLRTCAQKANIIIAVDIFHSFAYSITRLSTAVTKKKPCAVYVTSIECVFLFGGATADATNLFKLAILASRPHRSHTLFFIYNLCVFFYLCSTFFFTIFLNERR